MLIIVLAVIVLVLFGGIAQITFYRAGWELSTDLVALYNRPLDSRFDGPASNLQWDADDLDYGSPDIKASVSDIREEIPKMPYETIQADYEQFKYVVDYHEYLFDVQVRTIANVKMDNFYAPQDWFGISKTNYWVHETSMPYSYRYLLDQGGEHLGENFDGGVYARFSCLPWGVLDFGPVPENYTFNGYWLGIMNAKVESEQNGVATPNVEISHLGWVRNIQSVGSQLNMYQDDGSFTTAYAQIPWDSTKVLDPDIKSVVVVYLPFDLMAGAFEHYDSGAFLWNGAITECKPVDYYLTYTVRMECLVVKEFEARDPATPPNPSPIEPPKDYVPYTPYGFWDKYGFWLIILGVVFLGGLVFMSMFTGIGLFALFQGRVRFTQFPNKKGRYKER